MELDKALGYGLQVQLLYQVLYLGISCVPHIAYADVGSREIMHWNDVQLHQHRVMVGTWALTCTATNKSLKVL